MVTLEIFGVPAKYREDNGPYTFWLEDRRFRLVFYFCTDTWQIWETFDDKPNVRLVQCAEIDDCLKQFNAILDGTAKTN